MEEKMILLVEHELSDSEVLKSTLEAKQLAVLHVTNGREALTVAREKRPDLVILNIMIPKMNGYQLCKLLKCDRRFSDMPVIVIGSGTQVADRELALACGGSEYVTKPYDINELVGVAKRYLNNGSTSNGKTLPNADL